MKQTVWIVLVWIAFQGAAKAVSFDCEKAQSKAERLICSDAELSSLDEELARVYATILNDKDMQNRVRKEQRQWLRSRDDCINAACIRRSYQDRIQSLQIDQTKKKKIGTEKGELFEEAQKAVYIQAVLKKFSYEMSGDRGRSFCGDLFKALQDKSSEIAYIEPVLRTDDPRHPGLAKYETCSRDERPRGESSFELCSIGDKRFRLYQLDADGNSGRGLEEYLYGQDPDCHPQAPAAQYASVNLETCQRQQTIPVASESLVAEKSEANKNINALISFRANHLIIDVADFSSAGISVSAWSYNKKKRGFQSPPQCIWRSLKQ